MLSATGNSCYMLWESEWFYSVNINSNLCDMPMNTGTDLSLPRVYPELTLSSYRVQFAGINMINFVYITLYFRRAKFLRFYSTW